MSPQPHPSQKTLPTLNWIIQPLKKIFTRRKRTPSREVVLQSHEDLLNHVIYSSDPSLASEWIAAIKIERFDPMQTPPSDCFFHPLSVSQLDEHPRNLNDPAYLLQHKTVLFVLDQAKHANPPAIMAIFDDPAQYLKFNCSRLIDELSLLRNTKPNPQSLLSVTGWTCQEYGPHPLTLSASCPLSGTILEGPI